MKHPPHSFPDGTLNCYWCGMFRPGYRRLILRQFKSGSSIANVARKFKVYRSTVQRVIREAL